MGEDGSQLVAVGGRGGGKFVGVRRDGLREVGSLFGCGRLRGENGIGDEGDDRGGFAEECFADLVVACEEGAVAKENVGFHCAGNDGPTTADVETSVVRAEEMAGSLLRCKEIWRKPALLN